ncbi:MAG: response regulator [Promethearchaeota archaeon]
MVKILIVDDEISICETLAWSLIKEGYEVEYQTDSEKIEDAIESSNYDIYIIDIFLPGRSGFEIIKLIKEFNKNGVILIISGYPNVSNLIDSVRLEVYDYIKKPFTLKYLKEVINHILLLRDQKIGNEFKKVLC